MAQRFSAAKSRGLIEATNPVLIDGRGNIIVFRGEEPRPH